MPNISSGGHFSVKGNESSVRKGPEGTERGLVRLVEFGGGQVRDYRG